MAQTSRAHQDHRREEPDHGDHTVVADESLGDGAEVGEGRVVPARGKEHRRSFSQGRPQQGKDNPQQLIEAECLEMALDDLKSGVRRQTIISELDRSRPLEEAVCLGAGLPARLRPGGEEFEAYDSLLTRRGRGSSEGPGGERHLPGPACP